jgi:Family of unknown function (DUF5678)
MQEVLDEIIEKAVTLSDADQRELISRLVETAHIAEPARQKVNGQNFEKYLTPNTEWMKMHRDEYGGNYVALKNGELIAYGRTIKEADLAAKAKGVNGSLLAYLPRRDEILWADE